MLMIVAYHYSIWGFYAEDIMYSQNKYFVDIFGMGGKLGTDIFVLISGYYMVSSSFNLRKLLRIIGQVWFYTLGAVAVFLLIPGLSQYVTLNVIKRSLFPLITSHYWFISYYVILMLLSPFINAMLHSISKKQHMSLCLILAIICTVLPEFLGISFASGSLPLFILLYVSAAYYRLHIPPGKATFTRSLWLSAAVAVFCVSRVILTDYFGQKRMDEVLLVGSTNFMNAYSPFAYLLGLLLLIVFSSMPERNGRFISTLGSCTMGVYLFQSNILVSNRLWQPLFHTSQYGQSPYLFLHAIAAVGLVFLLACIIDLIRQKSFARVWEKLIDWLCPRLEKLL